MNIMAGRKSVVVELAADIKMVAGLSRAQRVAEMRRAFEHLAAPVRRVGGFDVPYPAAKLEHLFLPGVDRVLDAVELLDA